MNQFCGRNRILSEKYVMWKKKSECGKRNLTVIKTTTTIVTEKSMFWLRKIGNSINQPRNSRWFFFFEGPNPVNPNPNLISNLTKLIKYEHLTVPNSIGVLTLCLCMMCDLIRFHAVWVQQLGGIYEEHQTIRQKEEKNIEAKLSSESHFNGYLFECLRVVQVKIMFMFNFSLLPKKKKTSIIIICRLSLGITINCSSLYWLWMVLNCM